MVCGCDFPPHKRNWRLYELLEVESPTTSKIVKWMFRKVTLRQHYYQAYLVLYNRARRHLYDHIGEDAYGFIVSGTWGPLIPMFGYSWTVVVYTFFMLIEVAMLILFFAFIGAQDDGLISWSLDRLAAPLYVFVCLMVLITFFAMIVNFISSRTRKEGMHWVDRLSPVGNLLAACCYFCLPFVIGIRLRDGPQANNGKYLTYIVMPILGDVIYYSTSFIWRWPRRLRLQMEVNDNSPSPVIHWGIFIMGFLNMFCGIAQWVLLAYKLDNRYSRSWYVTFIPFCFRAGIRVIEALLRSLMKHTITVKSSVGVAFDTLGSFFTNGILLISLYFVAVRIERGYGEVHLARALIPVYVTLAYMFICLIITMIYLLVRGSRSNRVGAETDANWVPPPEGAGLGVGAAQQQQRGQSHSLARRPLNSTDSSELVAKSNQHRSSQWDNLDGASTESAAFPENLSGDSLARGSPVRASPPRRVPADNVEYDDFYTDEEDTLFPEPTPAATEPSHEPSDEPTPNSRDGFSSRRRDRRHSEPTEESSYLTHEEDEEEDDDDDSYRGEESDDDETVSSGEEESATSGYYSDEESEETYGRDDSYDDSRASASDVDVRGQSYDEEDTEDDYGSDADSTYSGSPDTSGNITSSYDSAVDRRRRH